jgi:type IV pilus assembly protein PilM
MLSIDITDKQLKLVKGSLAGNKIRINDVGTRDVPDGSIVNGYVNSIPLVAGEITDMLAGMKIAPKGQEIIVCINSSSILYKELEVLKPKKITNTAAIEAMIITQMGIANDYNVSYSIVGEGTDSSGASTIKVMATACPQRMVDSYTALFSQLGLKLKQINISNNCITRLILNTPKLREVMPFLCIQVDVDFININLYEDGQVALSRYVKIDPSDYENNPDYINIAVFDNLFRMIQFIGQRPGSRPLKQIIFYGIIKDFVALSNSILSFNIPAHVLAMPNNIVKFCEVDFSRYANAIGAFYKVDPLKEHINLLASKVVKSKRNANLLPLQVLLVAGVGVGAVVLALSVVGGINLMLTLETAQIQREIDEKEFPVRRIEMDMAEEILTNFSAYKYSVQLSQTLFDFLPRGNLPQMMEQIHAAARQVEIWADDEENQLPEGQRNELVEEYTFFIFDNVEWSNYDIDLTIYTGGIACPANFVDALNHLGFFENIDYEGFETILWETVNENVNIIAREGNVPTPPHAEVVKFDISMQLKGGHTIMPDGEKYTYNPEFNPYAPEEE